MSAAHPIIHALRAAYAKLREDPDSPFNAVDENKDGKLDRSEAVKLLPILAEILPGSRGSFDGIDAFMKEVDKDGDGTISYREFMGFMSTRMVAAIKMMVKEDDSDVREDKMFDMAAGVGKELIRAFDWDEDGVLNAQELAKLLQLGVQLAKTMAKMDMEELTPIAAMFAEDLTDETALAIARETIRTFGFENQDGVTPQETLFALATTTLVLLMDVDVDEDEDED